MEISETFWLTTQESVMDVIIFIACIAFLILPKPARREYLYLGAFLIATFITDFVTTIGFFVFKMNMNPVNNVSSMFRYTFLVLFYRDQIHIKNVNLLAFIGIGLLLTSAFIDILIGQGIMTYVSYNRAISNVIIVAIVFFHFYQLITKSPLQSPMKSFPMFWIDTAMLIFHIGTFFVYVFTDYLVTILHDNLIVPFYIHHTFGLIFYSILAYTLFMIRSENRKGVSSSDIGS